jgi:membrane fusion protein (multidrug efflux system)
MKPENVESRPTRPEPDSPAPPPRVQPIADATPGPAPRPRGPWRRRILLSIVALVVLAGIAFGVKEITFYAHHAETDDAQIEGHIDPVLPKISGYVTRVLVDDNQPVQAGQLLLTIDARDLQSKADTARATLANAEAAVAVAQANVVAARTASEQAARDFARYAALRAKEEISQQQYDAARAAAESGSAQLSAARRSVEAARAQAEQKRADLQYAELQVSYATVTAPVAGRVARKSIEVGQFVQAGQPLLAIVEDVQPWVVANFKETQLKKMRVGQPVEIEVDAYPKHVFHARVDSISPATGAKFALLPPDNATGNFTKVVQRVPVKIVFTDPPDPARPLRAGMSVNAVVRTD